MKTENTPENKAKFMLLHWNVPGIQPLWHTKMEWQYGDILRIVGQRDKVDKVFHGNSNPEISFWQLPLTPISQITDEDAIYVAKLSGWSEAEGDSEATCIRIGKKIAKELAKGVNTYSVDLLSCFEIKDYLVSNGYALDWNGVPVKTMIKWGWIKLK